MIRTSKLILLYSIILILFNTTKSFSIMIIDDAEITTRIEEYIKPLLNGAMIKRKDLNVYVINDKTPNAFAYQNSLFVNTGLITFSDNPSEVIGVLAHEMGHIVNNHLINRTDRYKNYNLASASALIAGMILTVITQMPFFVGPLLLQKLVMDDFLSFSRTQEHDADMYAAKLLYKINYPINGFVEMLEKLENDQRIATLYPQYTLTHPISKERIEVIKKTIKKYAQYKPAINIDKLLYKQHKRIKEKIKAFTYPVSFFNNQNNLTNYTKSIIAMRNGKTKQAINIIKKVIKNEPKNPFLYQLLGDMFLQNNQNNQSIQSYSKAYNLSKNINIGVGYAISLTISNKDALIKKANTMLRYISKQQTNNARCWYWLGMTYKKLNNMAMAHISQSNFYLAVGNINAANIQLEIAKKYTKGKDNLSMIILMLKKQINQLLLKN